jgi:hypothetical protein
MLMPSGRRKPDLLLVSLKINFEYPTNYNMVSEFNGVLAPGFS